MDPIGEPQVPAGPVGEPVPAPAPGWYVDPRVGGQLRWFDGETWTSHYAPMPPSVPSRLGTPRTHPLAIASLVCSLCALLTCGVSAVPGIVLGHVARRRIRASAGADTGDALALAGLTVGYVIVTGMAAVVAILLLARS